MTKRSYFQEWFCNPRRDLIAGAVVALALIPEAIAFSLIATAFKDSYFENPNTFSR